MLSKTNKGYPPEKRKGYFKVMAHNIELNANGTHSFVSAGNKTAWHGLGQILSDKFLTAAQCIEHANMDYTVEKTPVYIHIGDKSILVPDTFNTYRTDTLIPFSGTVGNKYTIVQNTEAFAFFDAIVGEGAAIYETAGVLGIGERIFLTAKLPDFCRIEGTNDITEMFVVLSMSHDGSGAIKAMITPIRVVCQNTLNAAIRNAVNSVNIRHTAKANVRLEQAHKVLGISNTYMTEFNEVMNKLAKTKISDTVVDTMLTKLFPTAEGAKFSTRAENIRNEVLTAYHSGIGQNGIVGTAYGFYNGITNYLNHVKNYGNPEKDIDRSNTIKFESIMEGQSRLIQQNCFDQLVAMI